MNAVSAIGVAALLIFAPEFAVLLSMALFGCIALHVMRTNS